MGARTYAELTAWQLAEQFKREVFRLQATSASAGRDLRYRSQLLEAAAVVEKDVAEGFLRASPGDFARFLGFALGSLAEAELRLRDGVLLGYFTDAACAESLQLAKRTSVALSRLRLSQFAAARRPARPRRT
jgi:four helix bundle protein